MSTINTKRRPKGEIIDGQKIKVGNRAVRVPVTDDNGAPDVGQQGGGNGQVETVTDQEGIVRKIVVQCACGEKMVIECKYKGE